jgi:hypothetical protein
MERNLNEQKETTTFLPPMTTSVATYPSTSGSRLTGPAVEFHEEKFQIGNRLVKVGKAEAMNPAWRATMEDVSVIHAPSTWGAPDTDLAFFGLYDGHGGLLTLMMQ